MLHRLAIAAVLVAGAPLAAAPRGETPAVERPVSADTSMTLGERGGWGLFLGVAILGLALRRRRRGQVVTS
ncbi:hypothetical protein [Glacieibacterium frigidum]|uniref:Uncharacterized protein n=1 Tax=Glacieibacterium frigidum TaxID=2593303 RepID=A0A552UGP5_9SPHN|nr:hypothetical protein [Glacieibacterium frigidum]TRW17394.1 hypothetical protein FMM06_04275 [Glacieibacterium frigidum]